MLEEEDIVAIANAIAIAIAVEDGKEGGNSYAGGTSFNFV